MDELAEHETLRLAYESNNLKGRPTISLLELAWNQAAGTVTKVDRMLISSRHMSVNIANPISSRFGAPQPDTQPTTRPPAAGTQAAPGATGKISSKVETTGARVKAFVRLLGQAPRALHSIAIPRAEGILRSLKATFEVPTRTGLRQMAAQRECLTACRQLFHIARQGYGVPIARHVARLDESLDRLLAAHGPNTAMSREVLLNDTVLRALRSLPDDKFLRSARGVGDRQTLTQAERKFREQQLERKLPDDVRQRIAKSLESKGDKPDSPTLRLIRHAVGMHASVRLNSIPTQRLAALNNELAAENDKLILEARRRSGALDGG